MSEEPEGPSRPIDRRAFLRRGAAGAALAAAGTVRPLAAEPTGPEAEAAGSDSPLRPPEFELEEITVRELQEGMEAGRWTAQSLVEAYLTRIEALDRRGPALGQVLELNPDALGIAEGLDRERREGHVRGSLHGVPVLIKDNIDTGDRMMTTAGSLALYGSRAPRDSGVAARLREAGAVILGKTNLSEWANFRSTRSSSGWSGRGGQGRNPFALDRNPCGSSSGSGAAISANFAAVGVGTETDGSVVCPSHTNGIVGVKPTVGLVSRSGIIPISHSQDTAGPMCRTVEDAAILLSAMAGVDPRDEATRDARGHIQDDYTTYLDPGGLRGMRIGIPREGFFGYSPEADRVAEDAIRALESEGATVVDPVTLPHQGEYSQDEFQVLLYEFKADLNDYLASLGSGAPVKSLEEIIRFNEDNREREMPYFGQEIMHMAQEKGPLTEDTYRTALERSRRLAGPEGIDRVMDQHDLDALMAPTGAPAWPIDLVNGDHFLGSSSEPAAVSGYPNVTVPAGFVFGLPVGMSFWGRRWSEPVLLRIAYGFEQATRVRRAPTFARHAAL